MVNSPNSVGIVSNRNAPSLVLVDEQSVSKEVIPRLTASQQSDSMTILWRSSTS